MKFYLTIGSYVVFVFALIHFSPSAFAQDNSKFLRQSSIWTSGKMNDQHVKLLNFNPLISKDQSKYWSHEIDELRQATIFTVFMDKDPSSEQIIWKFTDAEKTISLTSRNLNLKRDHVLTFTKQNISEKENPHAMVHTYTRGVGWDTGSEIPELDNALIIEGDVAEILVYESILIPKYRSVIESYLALKYGITLYKEYINSKTKVLWKPNEIFSQRIAGIGRDNATGLYQRQSVAFGDTIQFTIALDHLAESNEKNTGSLDDQDYLIWADNGLPFLLQENNSSNKSNLISRQWLISAHGDMDSKSTEVVANLKFLSKLKSSNRAPVLMIDRSAKGDFDINNVELIFPREILKNGLAIFENVQWDIDQSGYDAFTFGTVPRKSKEGSSVLQFEEFPNPTYSGHYALEISLQNPSNIEIQIFDIHQRLLDTQRYQGQSYYRIPGKINGAAGTYTIKLKIGEEIFTKKLILQ